MIGGGVYAHTILGVAYDEAAGTYSTYGTETIQNQRCETGIRCFFGPLDPDSG
jgi:hypothetical protein